MGKHRGLVLVFVLFLTILSVSSASSAAPQVVGTKCVKAGAFRTSKSVNYQCKKSAKGLRWVMQSPKSTPITTTTSTTTTTIPVPTDEVAKTVHELLVAAVAKDVTSTTKIQYLSEEPVNTNGEHSAKLGVEPALKLFAQLGFDLPMTVIVLFAKTEDGVRNKLFAEGCSSRALSSGHLFLSATGAALNGSCSNNRVAVVAGPVSRWGMFTQLSIDFQHTLPHEIFHQWQMNTASSCVTWRCGNSDFPKWLYEGTPQFMTRVAFWSWNRSQDHASWLETWYTAYRPGDKTMCQSVTIEEMVDPQAPWGRPGGCAYSKGQLAIELLVAKYGGFEALKNLHTTKTTPGLSGFADHFQRVTGRTLAEFYSEANTYFSKRNFP